eukprot:3099391-Rhodomonas_salina.3
MDPKNQQTLRAYGRLLLVCSHPVLMDSPSPHSSLPVATVDAVVSTPHVVAETSDRRQECGDEEGATLLFRSARAVSDGMPVNLA